MSSLLPFLYQTRTLQRLSRTGLTTPAFRALLHSDSRGRGPGPRSPREPRSTGPSIPFELPPEYDNPDEPARVGKVIGPDGARSTITPTEQDVFTRIFDEIATRKQTSPAGRSSSQQAADPLGKRYRTAKATDIIRDTVKVIVQDAAEAHTGAPRQLHSQLDALHPLQETALSDDWEKILLRFPPKLRASAFQALVAVEGGQASRKTQAQHVSIARATVDDISDALEPLSGSVQDEVLRAPSRSRVENMMHKAAKDVDLWYVLETEVFPLVRQFGIAQEDDVSHADADAQDAKLPLHIYGPLYPSFLHTALRTFNLNFGTMSPYALQILPRVKALGPASYVLGVSTPFFNELIRITWKRLGDPGAVFDLLEEMRSAGLSFDDETVATVRAVGSFVKQVEEGQYGPFLREIMSQPEYKHALKPRIKHWMWVISESVRERQIIRDLHDAPEPLAEEVGFL